MHSHHPCGVPTYSHAHPASVSSSVATLISNNAPTFTVRSEMSQQSGTLVHRLFEGTLTSETRCLTCETVSHRLSLSLFLSCLSAPALVIPALVLGVTLGEWCHPWIN